MTLPSETSSPQDAPAEPAVEPTVHAVLVAYDGEARCVSGDRVAVLAEAAAGVAAGLVSQTFWFGGVRYPTTKKPSRVVFGHDDVVPLVGGKEGPEIDDLGLVDPESLGPPPAAPPGGVVASSTPASPFEEFDDDL